MVIDDFMNKRNEMTKEELLISIEEVVKELEAIRNYFDNVSDAKLIEVAVYTEAAIKSKYDFLLKEAKKRGINSGRIA
ncbi:YaaL family protein [Clostridium frigidicarnis]|uniref:DUF2508 domain-containing protein n=1 Tax=Clostridium frigidicarnis TaxID=84698 RepID=A0A1I1B9E0_9CLOT|nr:YaaL family protein [Clostridium frigidicarnis]SFB46974.1 Protein of unknown function [Clostridium frigidicarnis]